MSIKTKVAVAGIITTTVLLFAYVSLRSGTIEGEYVKTLVAQSDRIAIAFAGFEKEKARAARNLNRFLAETNREHANVALLAVADDSNRVLAGGKSDRYIGDRNLFDEITGAFTRGDFVHRKSAGYTVRYFEQTKFYIFVKETPSGRLLIAFPYKLRGKLMVKLLLEIALIVILAVVFTTALYLYLVRREGPAFRPRAEAARHAADTPAGKRPETVESPGPGGPAAESLAAISSRYADAVVSLYIINESMSSLEKHLEFAGGSHSPIGAAVDAIDATDEIGEELKLDSTLVLNRSRKLIIPLMHRGALVGAVSVSRDKGFSGAETADLKKRSIDLSRAIGAGLAR
ncbi:MAG TPA: hypothetical protein VLM75_01060 [Spirochaetota bacterium]|nr:hypothetical protein [Spirochaetota bacterium]